MINAPYNIQPSPEYVRTLTLVSATRAGTVYRTARGYLLTYRFGRWQRVSSLMQCIDLVPLFNVDEAIDAGLVMVEGGVRSW